jgi:hypothetical protein
MSTFPANTNGRMAHDRTNSAERHKDGAPFQFGLCHLFLLVLIASIYFALMRSTGGFVAALVIGIIVLRAVIVLLRIDNVMLSAIVGTFLAGAFLVCAGIAFGPVPSWLFLVSWLVYPPVGYVLGVLCAACRQLEYG